jgi:xanthomonalisin
VAAESNFDNPTVVNGRYVTGFGGTSFAAPRWAGFLALVNQQAMANGRATVGFTNPALYIIGISKSYSTAFHDVTRGGNPPAAGGGSGFNAVPGYDLVTGWGSPAGVGLINQLAGATAVGGGH